MTKYFNFLLLALIFFLSFTSQQQSQSFSSQNPQLAHQCEIQCRGADLCTRACLKQGSRNSKISQTIAIVVGVSTSFVAIILIAFFLCFRPCIWCPTHFYNRLRRKYNIIDPQVGTKEAFKEQVNKILSFFNPKQIKIEFNLEIDKQEYRSTIQKLKVTKENPYLVDIALEGTDDQIGQWIAKGSIVQKKNGIKFWMYKSYKKVEQDQQSLSFGKNARMILKSKQIKWQGMKGRWQCCQVQVEKGQNKKQKKRIIKKGGWEVKKKDTQTISWSQEIIQPS